MLLLRSTLLEAFRRAVEVTALGENLDGDDETIAARRGAECTHVERQARDLRRFAAPDRQVPDLRRAGARRQEIDAASVGGPVRDAVVLLAGRQPARRRACVELEQPEIGAAAIGREIGLTQRVDDPTSVGRQGGLGEARESNEVRRGQAMRCRRCEQRKCRQGGGQHRSLHRDPPDRREFYQAAVAVLGRMNPKTLE